MRSTRRWAVSAALMLLTMSTTLVASAAPGDPGDVAISGPDVARYQHPNGACIDWAKVAGPLLVPKTLRKRGIRNPTPALFGLSKTDVPNILVFGTLPEAARHRFGIAYAWFGQAVA